MSQSILLKYIDEQVIRQSEGKHPKEYGPVITISREYGCQAWDLAEKLSIKLNEALKDKDIEWKIFGREIVNKAAEKLEIHPKAIDSIYREKPPSLFEDFFNLLSEYYHPSDIKIKKTLAGIIKAIANNGHAIIIGRGGVVLTKDISKSYHIKLHARKEWRIKQVKEKQKITEKEAESIIDRIDKERVYLRNFFAGEELTNYAYDIIFNNETNTSSEIINALIPILTAKKLIPRILMI
ncbi:MAG: cytidylate kinase-like family protein [Spirochaetia bacterium]|nr:cytidylate kinase-like family protein [Spirochaetia bacterium]